MPRYLIITESGYISAEADILEETLTDSLVLKTDNGDGTTTVKGKFPNKGWMLSSDVDDAEPPETMYFTVSGEDGVLQGHFHQDMAVEIVEEGILRITYPAILGDLVLSANARRHDDAEGLIASFRKADGGGMLVEFHDNAGVRSDFGFVTFVGGFV